MTAEFDVTARIAQLFVYPVKSCAGVALQEVALAETGFDLDRAWMVVDAAGDAVTQREHARLALVVPQIKAHEVVLRAPGMLALHIQIDGVEAPLQVRVWDDVVPAYDMGAVAAQWFTDFLSMQANGAPAAGAQRFRLVRFDPDHQRLSSRKWTGDVAAPNQFSDGYPLLVLSQASLDVLNEKLVAQGNVPVGVERFRPNIVLAGLEAHDEDRLDVLQVATAQGEVRLKPVKPCARCPIPDIDPATALSTPTVGDLLQSYRQDPRVNGAITFGMNAILLSASDATLQVGQRVDGNFIFD